MIGTLNFDDDQCRASQYGLLFLEILYDYFIVMMTLIEQILFYRNKYKVLLLYLSY